MSARYYLISFVIVMVLTTIISWVKQTRTPREFFMIMLGVTLGFAGFVLGLIGLAKLLEFLGVAESGFVF